MALLQLRLAARFGAWLLLVLWSCAHAVGDMPLVGDTAPQLHLVTFMNRAHRMLAILQVSAEAYGLHPVILGSGVNAWWPDGLGAKINALRSFVFSGAVEGEDVVLFMDAFDCMAFAGEEDILAGFQEMERLNGAGRVFFNAEGVCYPPIDGICVDYPPSPNHRQFLNSGLMIGRASAWRELLKDPVPDVIKGSDQAWYQRQFREAKGQGLIELDRECRLLCTVSDLGEIPEMLVLEGRAMVRKDTGYRPPLVHWPGTGHWTRWFSGQIVPTTYLVEVFRKLYPDAARLVESVHLELQMGGAQDVDIYRGSGPGFWTAMSAVLCFECNVLRTGQGDCDFFNGFFSQRCWFWSTLFFGGLTFLPFGCLYDYRQRTGHPHPIPCLKSFKSRVAAKPFDLSV